MVVADDLERLLEILPDFVKRPLEQHENQKKLIEVVMDLGRRPEARFPENPQYLSNKTVSWQDLDYCVKRIGNFGGDNRSGVEKTLHRISSIRNREGHIIGLTCRVGRALFGTVSIIRDLLEKQQSILVLGKPGVGKTTMIREIARVLADEMQKRVVIIDTSNEIAGDGDIPHPAIGRARRMQVASPELQHHVMIEAVENHMPEVIIIDEIGTELEALAARTIAERGVQLVGTAHGSFLENLIKNPILCDLIGGIQYVTLGDDEARRRGTQKSILERKTLPAFHIAVELHERCSWVIHERVDETVDQILQGYQSFTQRRDMLPNGKIVIQCHYSLSKEFSNNHLDLKNNCNKEKLSKYEYNSAKNKDNKFFNTISVQSSTHTSSKLNYKERLNKSISRIQVYPLFLYAYSVSLTQINKVIETFTLPLIITEDLSKADIILALRSHVKQNTKLRHIAQSRQITIYTVHSSTMAQVTRALRRIFNPNAIQSINWQKLSRGKTIIEIEALEEALLAIKKIIIPKNQSVELLPRTPSIRKIQYWLINTYNFKARGFGEEPNRCLRIQTS